MSYVKLGLVLAPPGERIRNASTTPPIRLCVRTKRGMCMDSGVQNLIAGAAIEETNKPTPV